MNTGRQVLLQKPKNRPTRLLNLTPRTTTARTFATALDLPAAEKGVVDEVRQPAVEVDGGQAALEALPGDHQLGEVLVHVGAQASYEQVAWRQWMKNEHVEEFNWVTFTKFKKKKEKRMNFPFLLFQIFRKSQFCWNFISQEGI